MAVHSPYSDLAALLTEAINCGNLGDLPLGNLGTSYRYQTAVRDLVLAAVSTGNMYWKMQGDPKERTKPVFARSDILSILYLTHKRQLHFMSHALIASKLRFRPSFASANSQSRAKMLSLPLLGAEEMRVGAISVLDYRLYPVGRDGLLKNLGQIKRSPNLFITKGAMEDSC